MVELLFRMAGGAKGSKTALNVSNNYEVSQY